MPADLLIYIAIAVVLIIWLRNTLGTRHGDERDRSDVAERMMRRTNEPAPDLKILDSADVVVEDLGKPDLSRVKGVKVTSPDTAQALVALMRDLPGFDPHRFVTGAADAFAMIVEAFARGDLPTLKDLLSSGVYAAFESEINSRRDRGETVETEVHAVKSSEIVDVSRLERMVFIKVRFVAEETCVIRNRDGIILSGNPDKITTMNDLWVFGRELKSKDPTWYLFETADDVIEEHKTPLPDAR